MALVTCGECGKQISDAAASCPQCGAPGLARVTTPPPVKSSRDRPVLAFLILGIGLLFWWIASRPPRPPEKPPGEIELTYEMRRDMGAAIRERGYNCPEPKRATAKGDDAYGNVSKVSCGGNAEFRVTFTPTGLMLIEPWE